MRDSDGKKTRLLFAYGTLMQGLHAELQQKVQSKLVGIGSIRARLYDLGGFPGAKLSGDAPRSHVKGELYRLEDPESAIRFLDDYEEYHPGNQQKSLFVRKQVPVALEDGRKCNAWVYLYNRPVDEGRLITSGDYRDVAVTART